MVLIQILLDKSALQKILSLIFILGVVPAPLSAQSKASNLSYIDSLTSIITRYKTDTLTRSKASEELRILLMLSLKDNSLSQSDNNRVWNALRELETNQGVYFLKKTTSIDSLSREVLVLQEKLSAFQDSILKIQYQLINILEDKKQTSVTKEKATYVLSSIHSPEVVGYLFEHESDLQFSKLKSEDREEDEVYRTAMKAIEKEYIANRNWLVFPYLFQSIKQISYSEMGFIQQWLSFPTEYKSPWLLLEFMLANAEPKNRELILYMLTEFHQFKRPINSKNK